MRAETYDVIVASLMTTGAQMVWQVWTSTWSKWVFLLGALLAQLVSCWCYRMFRELQHSTLAIPNDGGTEDPYEGFMKASALGEQYTHGLSPRPPPPPSPPSSKRYGAIADIDE